jgi:outer membrane lipoprotein SlyB
MSKPSSMSRLVALAATCALGAPSLVQALVITPATLTSTAASSAAPAVAAAVTTKASAAAVATCANCGTVQEVTAHKKKGKGSGLGLVAGAVLGGVVGNQFGKGTGNTVTTVGGAVGGAVVGNEIEKNANKHTEYRTKIKMDDGTVREITLGAQYAVGARVTVDGDKVQPKP